MDVYYTAGTPVLIATWLAVCSDDDVQCTLVSSGDTGYVNGAYIPLLTVGIMGMLSACIDDWCKYESQIGASILCTQPAFYLYDYYL